MEITLGDLEDSHYELMAKYLRKYLKTREALEYSKRVEYFKGKKFLEMVQSEEFLKSTKVKVEKTSDASYIGKEMLSRQFFHKSDKSGTSKGLKMLVNSKQQAFDEGGVYTWLYSGRTKTSNALTVLIVVGFFLLVLFPVWPMSARVGVWYVSVTILLFLLGLIVVRLIVFCLCWLCGIEFWIFPNLFADDAGFMDSITPAHSFEHKGLKDQWQYRVVACVLVVIVGYWASNQDTDFDHYLQAQKEFVEDLYSGALLTHMSHNDLENIDNPNYIPRLDEILREEEEEEAQEKIEEEGEDDEEKLMNEFLRELEEDDADDNEEDAPIPSDEKLETEEL